MDLFSRRHVIALGGSALATVLGAFGFVAAASPVEANGLTGNAAHRHGFAHGLPGADLQAIAAALHLTPAELLQQLRAGKTVAQIAQAQNVPLTTVEDAIVAAAKTRLDRAVDAKRITSAQETEDLDKLKARLPQLLNAPWRRAPRSGSRPNRNGAGLPAHTS